MIHYDITQASRWRHRSGLARLSARLLEELGDRAKPVRWPLRTARPGARDWFFTAELFSEGTHPGLAAFLAEPRSCWMGAVFYDAIPLKFPTVTWPASVARHPGYLTLLARFDRVWAISQTSREELLGFWAWQGVARPPPVEVLRLGADFDRLPRVVGERETNVEPRAGAGGPPQAAVGERAGPIRLVSVGIIEPRKNQDLLLDVCEELWAEGLDFELHLAGRVNPHFGRPTVRRIRDLARTRKGLHHHRSACDERLRALCAGARALVQPSLAEGCGLPLIEALWLGVPCVCSDAPSFIENAAEGGCVVVPRQDRAAWKEALRRIVSDAGYAAGLAAQARSRPLPTWSEAAATLKAGMAGV